MFAQYCVSNIFKLKSNIQNNNIEIILFYSSSKYIFIKYIKKIFIKYL